MEKDTTLDYKKLFCKALQEFTDTKQWLDDVQRRCEYMMGSHLAAARNNNISSAAASSRNIEGQPSSNQQADKNPFGQ